MNIRQGGPGGRRSRGRHNNNGGNGSQRGQDNRPRTAASLRHQTFDSNGPDVRVRGNATQVYEKYQALARDAQSSGDRVLAESYLQHAEHYYRITEAINEALASEQRSRTAPAQPFGSQPEMPANYYTPDGQLMGGAQSQSQPQPQQQPESAPPQAEVSRKTPPASDPFFTPDETEDSGSGPQKIVAGR